MASTQAHDEVQSLLRFLTQDAKVPLAAALPKIAPLRKLGLTTSAEILKAGHEVIRPIFENEKIIKQVFNAAKRATTFKKRGATEPAATKGRKRVKSDESPRASIDEDRLVLPESTLSATDLAGVEIETNRAPLVLAFAVVVLKHTMPEQPLSSRLSLAQALVSANSQSKARSVGLISGQTADEEGWANGQPKVKILGRDIAILRRHNPPPVTEESSDAQTDHGEMPPHDTYWGLDLETLRTSNGPLVSGKFAGSVGPPIHSPEAARAYLGKSMTMAAKEDDDKVSNPKKKLKPAQVAEMKENALSMVLKAIDLLCESWSTTLSVADLDSRAWSWYVNVRPDIAQGQAGWGQKGTVRLGDILKLRREQ